LRQRMPPLEVRGSVRCVRCDAFLYRQVRGGFERALAYSVTAAVVFVVANASPIASLEASGTRTSTTLLGTATFLRAAQTTALAWLVFATAFLMPALEIGLTASLLALARRPSRPHWFQRAVGLLRGVRRWSMIEVFALAALAALPRLGAVARVEIGWGLWAFAALMVLMAAVPAGPELRAPILELNPRSTSRALALLLGAAILYAPANLLPVLDTTSPLGSQRDTLISGVGHLWMAGAWPLALVILTASIVIPFAKLLSLAFLVWSVRRRRTEARLGRARLYRLIERIGRWSMVDIFVGALLGKLVQFPGTATVSVGPGAVAFGGVVVLTMLATHTFDPRQIWSASEVTT
jgi:paraquat-inducible protein A